MLTRPGAITSPYRMEALSLVLHGTRAGRRPTSKRSRRGMSGRSRCTDGGSHGCGAITPKSPLAGWSQDLCRRANKRRCKPYEVRKMQTGAETDRISRFLETFGIFSPAHDCGDLRRA
jgi:hypothetical protein